ncbi:DUF3276 family protein [Mariniphaga sediminis]|uniref:DUF3276 family protein n=1 Tax=Mariniphaga sediminis TaxID=1628158 RepID=UPI003561FD1A
MENVDYKGEKKKPEINPKQGIHSKTIRAGKRTYFFDVKSTRNDEYYLTITESKKKFGEDGNFRYEKHKLFLYPEDFEKFSETLEDVIGYIHENQPEIKADEPDVTSKAVEGNKVEEQEEISVESAAVADKNFSDLEFDDI